MSMIRTAFLICASFGLLVACGDGRGSQYSSARAVQPQQTYIPVTPGATPVTQTQPGVLTGPVAITPGATPVDATVTQAAVIVPPSPTITATPTPAAVSVPAPAPAPVVRFATGPIFNACRSAGRKSASKQRCGCIQYVADQELTSAQQRRGAGYFTNQHKLQEVRQSSQRIASNGEFWKAWKAYGQSAERQCRGT